MVHKLSNDTQTERIVHGFAEVVAIKFYDVRMILYCITKTSLPLTS
jgi:hypothetical protein